MAAHSGTAANGRGEGWLRKQQDPQGEIRVLHLSVDHWNFQPFNDLKNNHPNAGGWSAGVTKRSLKQISNFDTFSGSFVGISIVGPWSMSQHALHKLANSRGELDRETLGTLYQISRRRSKKRTSLEKEWLESWTRMNSESLREKFGPMKCIFQPVVVCVRKKTWRRHHFSCYYASATAYYFLQGILTTVLFQNAPTSFYTSASIIYSFYLFSYLKVGPSTQPLIHQSDSPKPRLCHVELRHYEPMDPPNPLGWFWLQGGIYGIYRSIIT